MAGVIKAAFKHAMVTKTFNNTEGLTLHLSADSAPLTKTSEITELSTGNGYSTGGAALTDWTVISAAATHTSVVFTATGGPFLSPVYGYFVKKGALQLFAEIDAAGPHSILVDETYTIDLGVS